MSRRSRVLRPLIIWTGPVLTVVLMVLGGFLYWTATTTAGARWALVTAAGFAGGEVRGVSGNLRDGLTVGHFSADLPALQLSLTDFQLELAWAALGERIVHIRRLAAGEIDLALTSTPEAPEPSPPFEFPALPVEIRVDQLALGAVHVRQDDEPVPVELGNLLASVHVQSQQARLSLSSLNVLAAGVETVLDGELSLQALAHPWPFAASFTGHLADADGSSVLCARRYLPSLPPPADSVGLASAADPVDPAGAAGQAGQASARGPAVEADSAAADGSPVQTKGQAASSEPSAQNMAAAPCTLDVRLAASGSLELAQVDLQAQGQGMLLRAGAGLTPEAALPLRDANVDLVLPDASSLQLQADTRDEGRGRERLLATVQTQGLDIRQLAGADLPSAVLTMAGRLDVAVQDRQQLTAVDLDLAVAEGSVWNDQPLAGVVQASVRAGNQAQGLSLSQGLDVREVVVDALQMDVSLGSASLQAQGNLGWQDSQLELQAKAPALAVFWPGLPGGVTAGLQVDGHIGNHHLDVKASYQPDASQQDVLGSDAMDLHLALAGGWDDDEGWAGRIEALDARHAGLGLALQGTPGLRLSPAQAGDDPLWSLGSAGLSLSLDGREVLDIVHEASSGGHDGSWATRGQVASLVLSQALFDDIRHVASRVRPGLLNAGDKVDRGGVTVRGAHRLKDTDLALSLDWDLAFAQALTGQVRLQHLSGDLLVPADPPFPLNLETLALKLAFQPQQGGASQVVAELDVASAGMGSIRAAARTHLQGLSWTPAHTVNGELHANVDDLAWLSLFTGDALEFGGRLVADVSVASGADGSWQTDGEIQGSDLRIVRVDDGVRLIDGTLAARLDGERLILGELTFPARLRVEPKEWRTAEWVSTNPEARDGYLRIGGDWHLTDMLGEVRVALHRFPVLQRSDRYAMISGELTIDAILPALSITGSVTADAGWFDLDMLGGIPTVDGDVVVIRGTDLPEEVDVPIDVSMDIEVDLGPRFYLTGYGVNSGLIGSMRVVMVDNRLTGLGVLRTRGGAIETYGQRLQLRRGTITFQGDIANPILDIEALRRGLAIEAGVKVAGTARRPKIVLVSYPEVSEVEKLSWLLFGHGPDESGGDMALLVSVGTSFLGDGEPFYRKFGIDEVSLQSGELGSAGSILPVESVVSGLNSGPSDLERQFISVTKGISSDLTIGLRQALSDTGTVGRVTYRLMRGLTAELSIGTVNGLALIYRWFSREQTR